MDRFKENCRLPVALRREGSLQTDEVISAGMRFIRQAQEEVFKEEIQAVKAERELQPWSKHLGTVTKIKSENALLK